MTSRDIHTGAALELLRVSKTFGPVIAVDGVSLTVAPGEFLTLLGPSGSGKTTTLMMIAGFESATAGEIMLDGRPLTRVPPYRRNLGMVFQHYALFPHMTVYDNVAFPLRTRGATRTETNQRVAEALDRVHLPGYGARFPAQLSGGQQQRVALARALAYRPPVLLMDEPLGALDKKLREQMQLEIKHIQRELQLTVIYVTHDQEEALTMSDRIVVMRHGRVVQLGPPEDLYERPIDRFVADFIGQSNFLEVTVRSVQDGIATAVTDDGLDVSLVGEAGAEGTRVTLALRPERVRLAPAGASTRAAAVPDPTAPQWWAGVIEEVVYIGATRKYQVRLRGQVLVAQQQAGADVAGLRAGERVTVGWSMADLRVVHTH
ncbi:MAG TPA: ABC transporter ATP-binding protein [Methylomirabilota bacterium]|jgi:spermidine/putrescine ABC transporter ATP-binding subunit|nr:ABC transporter ATP-binding protein [Methylomirabilota bacterium]